MATPPVEQAVTDAATIAGDYLRRHAFVPGTVEWKKRDDPVTMLDREAERLIKEHLEKFAPGNYVGEESGAAYREGRARTYHIDPLDGTKSMILRDFTSAVSIGVEENGMLTGGVVHDFMRGITYVGFHGDAYVRFDGQRHEFRTTHGLSKHRLSIDDAFEDAQRFPRERYKIMEKSGSIALAMAELAAGNYDGMVCKSIGKGNTWDVAAGAYLLQARGFVMLDGSAEPFDYKCANRGLIALKRDIADEVLGLLAQGR